MYVLNVSCFVELFVIVVVFVLVAVVVVFVVLGRKRV